MFTTTESLYERYSANPLISTDTRNIAPGSLFFALKGDKFDGNLYASEALEKGAAYVVVDNADIATNDRMLLVEDVLASLQDLARHHRKTFEFPVVALTGSNGKTTTKELIAAVLGMKFNVYATKGNLNNHIGVPLTLLSIDPKKVEIAVIEMGANHQQEIALLSSIARPTHGLITNIGKAHLEGFGGIKGIMKGKGELLDFLSKYKGTVFVNVANDPVMEMVSKRRAFGEIVFYCSDNNPVNPQLVSETPAVTFSDQKDKTVSTNLPGKYNFDNICAALAVGKYFDVTDEDAYEAVSAYKPDNNRSQLVKKGSNTVMMDAYNANPSSMAAAVDNFATQQTEGKKIVILGDMLELGDAAAEEHLELGKRIASHQFDIVILAGQLMQHALPALPKAYYFPDKFSLHNWIMDNPQQNATFLIKGSRGMALETVLSVMPG